MFRDLSSCKNNNTFATALIARVASVTSSYHQVAFQLHVLDSIIKKRLIDAHNVWSCRHDADYCTQLGHMTAPALYINV